MDEGQKAQKVKETSERINKSVSHALTNLFYLIVLFFVSFQFSQVHALTIYRVLRTGRTRNNILKLRA